MKNKLFLLFAGLFLCSGVLSSVQGQTFRSFEIGSLWDTFYASSAHPWQYSWQQPYKSFMIWPANRNMAEPWNSGHRFEGPVNASASSYWIGASPWTDENGDVKNEHVSEVGWWFWDEVNISIPVYIKKVFRQEPPGVVVNDIVLTELFPPGDGDELRPNLVSDQMIENQTRTDIGVDILQRAYAYTNHHFDNMIIVETVFTNTGNINLNDTLELANQELTNVYFDYSLRPTISREGHLAVGTREWHTHEFAEYYGADPGDSLKLFYAWDGDNVDDSPDVEDTGDPDPDNGMWLSGAYIGISPIHADVSPTDENNDPAAPRSAQWVGYTFSPSNTQPGNGINRMYDFMSEYPSKLRSWDGSGDTPVWEGGLNSGDPNWHNENQLSMHVSYGPYQMQPGEDWRFVFAKIVNGVNQQDLARYGAEYKAAVDGGNPDDFSWTNPTTGQTYTGFEAKQQILATGRDSLFKSAAKAKFLVENDFNVPDPPMSPSLFVYDAGGGIDISWSNDPAETPDPDTGVLDFEGYRLYRQIGRYDSVGGWEKIYEGTANSYFDTDVPRGAAAYYYCTAFDDGTQNTWGINPGEKLESSKFWNMTKLPAFRQVGAAENPDMSLIEPVPNPYNINDPNNFPGENNKILFVNLPGFCTITIFTISGEIVRVIEHDNGTGDESWDQLTSENQFVTSGVYLYHVQEKDVNGNKLAGQKIGKLVIIR